MCTLEYVGFNYDKNFKYLNIPVEDDGLAEQVSETLGEFELRRA